MKETATFVLLFFGVGVCIISSLGILVMRGMYDKLHYLSPMSTIGAGAVAAAVILTGGGFLQSLKVVLLLLLLTLSSAVLTQATGRAMEVRGKRKQVERGAEP